MLVLALVLFELPFLYVHSINLTYILRREQNRFQPSCIAEELERYAAVGWVYPMSSVGAGIPNIATKYIPTIESDYNCKFGKNDKCSLKWAVTDWQLDYNSSKTKEFIGDSRWEDLATILISNESKEFEHKFNIKTADKNGFSVRALGAVELFICTGWNPYNYPCYYFYINQREIFFHKYGALPTDLDFKNEYLKHYNMAFSNILSNDEWRNFEVSVDEDGNVTLVDKNLNRNVLEYHDAQPLTPMYFLMRSNESSLWKIINNQFMYTETEQISQFGPMISTTYKDLCISLFAATCSNCEMHFFYLNGTNRKSLEHVGPTDNKWIEIKLKQENVPLGRLNNIFVETKFVWFRFLPVGQNKGWWAYDDVRVCNENEVKVTYLKLEETFAEDDVSVKDISCQLIKMPSFKPIKLEYDQIEDFPQVTAISNDTSITLSWPQKDPNNYINYFIVYQEINICLSQLVTSKRLQSDGFLSTKHNKVTIGNLVPYTVYNITISSVLHRTDKSLRIMTLETDEPTLEELPSKIHIEPLGDAVNISWERPSCNDRYGRLVYTIIVTDLTSPYNKYTRNNKTDHRYQFEDLWQNTTYTLTVLIARNAKNLMKGLHTQKLSYTFRTLDRYPPRVNNLKLYAIGLNSAYLRYDFYDIPTQVRVILCKKSPLECKTVISNVKRCILWEKMCCLKLEHLMPNQTYSFAVSIKNNNTYEFGRENKVQGITEEKEPSRPESITYQVVDCKESTEYCHLNISWLHPNITNNRKGIITKFNIFLDGTYFNTSNSEQDLSIREVYKIVNETYLSKYTYQVRYVPYSSTKYVLSVEAANDKLESSSISTKVKVHLRDYIDESPQLLKISDKALVFQLSHLDRRLQYYTVIIAIQDFNKRVRRIDTIKNKKLADNLCHTYGVTWISQDLKVEDNKTKTVAITGLDSHRTIKPNTKYCVIFIFTNCYHGEDHDIVYYQIMTTPKKSNNLLYMLLLLLLVPIGLLISWYIRNRKIRNQKQKISSVTDNLTIKLTLVDK